MLNRSLCAHKINYVSPIVSKIRSQGDNGILRQFSLNNNFTEDQILVESILAQLVYQYEKS